MPIELYQIRLSPPCRAVLMTAKQLNIKLDVKLTDLLQGDHMKPEYLKLNPSHTVPTLNDNGFVLWESRAIMQYLCNQYAPDSALYPKDPKKRAIVDRWLDFDMSLTSVQREALFPEVVFGSAPEDKANAYNSNLKLLDQLIGNNKYLTGDQLTIADLSILATAVFPHMFGHNFKDYPNFERWYTTLSKALPYFDEVNKFSQDEIEKMRGVMKARLGQQKK